MSLAYPLRRSNEAGPLRQLTELVAAGSEPAIDRLAALDTDAAAGLVGAARAHGLEAWLAASAPADSAAGRLLRRQRVAFAAARLRTIAVIDELRLWFAAIDCPWAVVKGPALAHSVYPRPDLRSAADLDVLVPESRFGDVLELLVTERGHELLDLNWPLLARAVPGELRVLSPRGVLIDLHWSLLNSPDQRRSFRLPSAQLLARRRWLNDDRIPALDAEDQLIHVGLHAAMSGGTRLSWLLDVHLAGLAAPDWPTVIVRARQAGAGPALALLFARAARLWATPVPHDVWRQLAGPVQSGLNRLVDRVSGLRLEPDRPALARSWARSVRPSANASLREFGQHVGKWLSSGPRHDATSSVLRDPSHSGSPLYPVENPAARHRYFAEINSDRTNPS